MAPPNTRRTGFSKRAQYGTFFGYVAALAGALVGGGVLLVSLLDHDAFSGVRGLAADVAAPAGSAVAAGRSGVQDAGATLYGWLTWGTTNKRMAQELELARVRLAEARAVSEENTRLKAMLGLRDALGPGNPKPVAEARLIQSSATSLRRFATISAGSDDRVAVGMPVRSPLGLVGRVLEVSRSTARVLLVTDPESLVPVRRARDGLPAFAQGKGDGSLQIKLINLGVNPLKPGDVFVTSGAGGLYRPGIAVGVVTQLSRDGAVAKVLSDPTASEFVSIEQVFAVAAGMPEALTPYQPPVPERKK
ncbi:rod shape-determining protein MreC [Novosphingobium flavum]|uniref:Cell shape-determining protein MreC n=1 Tax=Novosphingobium flavum TaxID=1778672 RepID=A0A7X1FQW4_9SPHN|nr:rod shape-determining protein MreC [Novosphingobium flavum]MBC2664747.1 rod shape-determining protein MreC [Novosphingobium flavum]